MVSLLASAGTGPIRSCDRMGPYDRTPIGGYLADATAAAASSAELTSGTMTPAAPASSALPIGVGSLASTRTIRRALGGVDGLRPASMPE